MPQPTSLTFKRTIAAPAAEVYRAFTHATALRDWLSNAAQVNPNIGGRIYLWWGGYHVYGDYLKLEPNKKIVFSWHGSVEPAGTQVQVTLAEKNGKTTVTLKHSGLGSGKAWAEARQGFEHEWPSALENLQSMLETGMDLRVARLPRMGILIENFDATIAKQLGVPVSQGVRLAGTTEGTGAHAAGLQSNDVMVSLAGHKLTTPDSLAPALRGHVADDKVKVVFYRGQEKKSVLMELSARPQPQYPATAAELAETSRQIYAVRDKAFSKLLAGLTEAEADKRPAPNEWSVKQLVAHFIADTRDLQTWIADMLNDKDVPDSLEYSPNVDARLDQIVARFKTIGGLLKELKGAQAETLGLLAALPPAFVARKHLYYRVAGWMTFVEATHLPDEHGEQFNKTIAAAKSNNQ